MRKENKELIACVMEAVYAKDKLEAIEKLIEETKADSVSKKALLAIIEKEEEPLGMTQ